MIGVAAAGKTSNQIQSLPVVGGIVACGIFLLFIAIVGLVGAIKHHQVMLFFYMVILFSIFVIQFSVACACLAASTDAELGVLEKAYHNLPNSTKDEIDSDFNCCGFYNENDTLPDVDRERCSNNKDLECHVNVDSCGNCKDKVEDKVDSAFNASGGLGLFFSFTEIIGTLLAFRFRNLMNPSAMRPMSDQEYNAHI